MPPVNLILEIVPPPRSDMTAGLNRRLAYIQQVQARLPIEAINIPDIHPEHSHHKRGQRRQPFKPHMAPRQFAQAVTQACGLPCIVNHVVAHRPADELQHWLQQTADDYGVSRFVLVGGEHHDIDYPGPSVDEANRIARALFPHQCVCIGNICIPSRPGESERITRKCEAGADFFTTQLVYEAAELTQLGELFANTDRTGTQASSPPNLYISFAPIKSAQNLRFLNFLGVQVSPELEAQLLEAQCCPLTRSCDHLISIWRAFQQSHPALTAGLNLCPIGNIDADTVIHLGRELLHSG